MVKDDRIIFRAGHDRKQAIKDMERQGLIKPGFISEYCRDQVDELITHIYSGNGHAIPEQTKERIRVFIEKKEREEALETLLQAKDAEYFDAIKTVYLQFEKIINGLLADENFTKATNYLCEAIWSINDGKRAVSQRYTEPFLKEQYDRLKVDGTLEKLVAERRPWIEKDW